MQLDITSESSNRIVQETAERDVYLAALEEKANTRLDECERLRRRVHALEQESAAREVIFVELKREKERVKDDNLNLNIALDSKQQELEMVRFTHSFSMHFADEWFLDQAKTWCQGYRRSYTCSESTQKRT